MGFFRRTTTVLTMLLSAYSVHAVTCTSPSAAATMPVVQNSHRIVINSSLNSANFSFATYVAPNTYNSTSFMPKQGHVWIHGEGRGGDEMVTAYKNSIGGAVSAGYIASADDVVLLSVVFPEPEDEAKTLFPQVLTWCDNGWMEAADSNEAAVSSFNVIRAAFDWLKTTYPSIDEFILGGHSAGGQTVQRFAVTNPTDSSPNRYIIANPSSMAYFDDTRPNCNVTSSCSCIAPGYESKCCSNYDDWKTGLENYPYRYQNASMTAADKSPVINRYLARTIHYLYGTADTLGGTNGCTANAQGLYHYDRGQKWWAYLQEKYAAALKSQTMDHVEGVGHNSSAIWTSTAGLERVYGPDEITTSVGSPDTSSTTTLVSTSAEGSATTPWTSTSDEESTTAVTTTSAVSATADTTSATSSSVQVTSTATACPQERLRQRL